MDRSYSKRGQFPIYHNSPHELRIGKYFGLTADAVLVGRSTAEWEDSAMVVSVNDQFGEGLSILSITITSTTALVG